MAVVRSFVVSGRLPGYNELHVANWRVSYRRKLDAMNTVIYYVRAAQAASGQSWRQQDRPVVVRIRCYEPNARRDRDNVTSGACKVILDALQQAGILRGDGQKYIRQITTAVDVDRENPRVEIEISEE